MFHSLLLAAALAPAQAPEPPEPGRLPLPGTPVEALGVRRPADPSEVPRGGLDPSLLRQVAARARAGAVDAPADTPVTIEVLAPLLPPPTTTPPPETPAAVAAAVPDRWALMRALQGTWPGALLDDHRMALWGWVQVSDTVSSNTGLSNFPVVWNDFNRDPMMQQAWLRFERTVVTSGTSEATFGFRSDWLVGTDYRYTMARGIFNGQLTANNGLPNRYGVDAPQFYGEAFIPTIGRGLDIKVGRWFTPFGVESVEAISCPTISRSYSFNYAPPFTHTGVLFTLGLTPSWTVAGAPVLGNDVFFDPATEGRFVGFLRWAPPGGRSTATFGTSVGRGKFNEAEAFNNINAFDLVFTHAVTPRLTYALETIYGYQTNAPLPGVQVPDIDPETGLVARDEEGNPQTISAIGTAHWLGIAQYLFYTFNPKTTGMLRLEFFDDFQGQRTGVEGLYTSLTGGATYKPYKSLWVRPELRYDYNNESTLNGDRHYVVSGALDFILRW